MRDVNLLPAWYPLLRRKRRIFAAQLALSGVVLTALLGWWGISSERLGATRGLLGDTRDQLSEKQDEVAHLQRIVGLQEQLISKHRVMSQIGLPVEQSRVLSAIIDAMPTETWLTSVNARTEERLLTAAELGITSTRVRGEAPKTRRLLIRIEGLALSDADVMTLFSSLSTNPVFENVKLGGSSEVQHLGRLVRRFDMSFQIRLDVERPKGEST
jgi:Tfp pilus assembly protein PilN